MLLKYGGTSLWKARKGNVLEQEICTRRENDFLFGLITINRRVIVTSALEVFSTSRVRTLLIGGKSPGRDIAE
jgi:hypothetical protein